MKKQKLRDEIDDKYKWNLALIYQSDKDFYHDLERMKQKVEEIKKYDGILFESAQNLKEFLILDEEIDALSNKIMSYANRKHDEDTTNTTYQKMTQEVEDIYHNYRLNTAFFLPQLYEKEETTIFQYLEEEGLSHYRRHFKELLRYKEHTLSKEKEELVARFTNALSSSDNTYSTLTDADITFPTIKDENDKEVELTESNFSIYIKSRNRRVRKEAFDALFSTYAKYKNTIASIYTGHMNSDIAITKVKKYPSTLERYLYPDNIDTSIYDNLIGSVSNRQDVIDNYFGTIKEVLGLDELHRYDTYTELVEKSNKKYSYEEAQEIVKNALAVLGEDYQKKLKEAFDSRWIDVYNNKGKRGGAYSASTFDTPPYILLNYEGKLNDVSTLAHELGHSMHSYYSETNNERINADYKIFVAEVASTTNELLLNHYLLKNSNNNQEKLAILSNLMSLYYATMLRQTMFAEFEMNSYQMREENLPITHEILEEKYYDLCKKYFGKHVILDDKIKYEWERIPHFYYGFYVYKYATSLAASTVIANKILTEDGFVDKYLQFLSSGCSMDPLDELKLVDIDLSKKEVIDNAMNQFNQYIMEFKDLYEKGKGGEKNE